MRGCRRTRGLQQRAVAPGLRDLGGYDESPESEHALAVALTLAAEFGGKVSAFEAVSIPAYVYLAVDAGSIEESSERRKPGSLGLMALAARRVR